MDYLKIFSDLLSDFVAVVPGLFGAIIVIIIGFIVSKILKKVISKFLQTIKIDTFSEKLNEIEMVHKSGVEVKLSNILATIVYYFVLVFFMVAATDILGMESISTLVRNIFEFIPNLIVAFIILVLGILVSDALKKVVSTACKSLGIASGNLIGNLLFYFLFINFLILALTQAGIQTEFLSKNISIVIGGIVFAFALGYGLASKDIVANFLASYYSNSSFKEGDKITIEGATGIVEEISKSTITIKTGTSRVILPLSKISSESVEIHD